MRSIFKGVITFGLVTIPVKLFSATEDHDLHASQVHAQDGGKIRYRRVCEACDGTVEMSDIAKMYETENGVAILTEDDLSTLPSSTDRQIEVLEFVEAGSIDPLMLDKPYYLSIDGKAAAKSYALLARTLSHADRVAIVRFAMRGRTNLAALQVVGKGEVLALHTLRWPDEVREPDFPELHNPPQISDAEIKMAEQLVASMAVEFNPDRYKDNYQEELRELVAARAMETSDDGTEEVSDLLAKLEQSAAALAPKPKRGRKAKVSMLAGAAS